MFTRTKIICTIGPAVSDYKMILKLIDHGMNVARLNFSHGDHEMHRESIEKLKQARQERNIPLTIMLDTKGPEVRLGKVPGDAMAVKKGDRLVLGKDIPLVPQGIFASLEPKMPLLIDDGYIQTTVIEVGPDQVIVEVKNPGVIKSRKGVNVPHAELDLGAMTEQDVADITFGAAQGIDLIAASFIRSAEHVLEIKDLLKRIGHAEIKVVAKIENAAGVRNFDSILAVSDGIMVARGDLGVEVPLTHVPRLQKMMIKKSYEAFKPVVTATQMLESMINNPLPTRAEVSDVANAIYDSTSAVMLSGETAVGKYPLDAVKIMRSTANEAEKDLNYAELFYKDMARLTFNDISSCVALACVKTAYSAKASAIFVFTNSGYTARAMSRFRPQMPIIAVTPNERVYHQLAFNWGVIPVLKAVKDAKEGFHVASCFALQHKLVKYGDVVAISAGVPFGISGTTNTIVVDNIGDVLIRGVPHKGDKALYGKIALVHDPKKAVDLRGKIAVITKCDPSYEKVFSHVEGVVLQNYPEDAASEQEALALAKKYEKPVLVRADGARDLLKNDQQVTLDAQKGIVFKGYFDAEEDFLKTCQNYMG